MTQILNQYPQFYQTNPEWAVLKAAAESRTEMIENATFDYIEVTLTLQRHSATYEATAVIPALGECVRALRILENPGNVMSLFGNIAFRGKLFCSFSASTKFSPMLVIILYFVQFWLC
jgi:hypothetical protein